MLECIKYTSSYKSLELDKNLIQAYLLYSQDSELNNNCAMIFAKTLLCEHGIGCGVCNSCKQFDSNSNPDLFVLNQDQIKVEDANNIIAKTSTLPISCPFKVFVILNAENMNETAQNKLLKTFEEPSSKVIFVLTASKTDKLLPTILSRMKKIYVPRLNFDDKLILQEKLKSQNIDISKYVSTDLNLTEMLNFVQNPEFASLQDSIFDLFTNLKTTQDIPKQISKLKVQNKNLFFTILLDIFSTAIDQTRKYDPKLITLINSNYSKKAIIHIIPLIEDAYKKQVANVNFNYVMDNLLFNILKEKFLCK